MAKAYLETALGYLCGRIESGHVTFAHLESFVEQDWSMVPDGEPQFERLGSIEFALERIARQVVKTTLLGFHVPLERLQRVLRLFGEKVAKGEVSPASLAILCDCTVSDFEA